MRLACLGFAPFVLALLVPRMNAFGQSAEPQTLRIRYLGHAAFEIATSRGARLLVDPYQNAWFSHWFDQPFPEVEAGVVVLSHSHFDHAAAGAASGNPQIVSQPGTFRGDGYSIRSLEGLHARPERYGTENRVILFEVDGVRIVHWGDNSADIPDEMLRLLLPVDVLILPIDDSEHILTFNEAESVRERLMPRVLIPAHYATRGLTSPCSTLEGVDHWLEGQNGVQRAAVNGKTISPDRLPGSPEVWFFESPPVPAYTGLLVNLPCSFRSSGPWVALAGVAALTGAAGFFIRRRFWPGGKQRNQRL